MKKKIPLLSAVLGAGVASGVAMWLNRRNRAQEAKKEVSSNPGKMEQELVKRMPDMIYYDRFKLAVQPVVDLQTGGIVGGEVLSRLDHPEQGIIFPDKFLPAVEQAGLYPKFDHYIFKKTCELLGELTGGGAVVQYLSCNFSRTTLSEKGIATRLAKIADSYGIPHDRLAVEITEREKETDTQQFCENLNQLHKAGFRIFVDDLGAGVNSVRDLWTYPVDVVKIDRALLLAADHDQGRASYRGLRNLAVELGCKVICEGVETEEQHRFVLEAGCHCGQGFLLYRPMEDRQFIHLMGGKSL